MTNFDDTHFDTAASHLISQLSNISRYLQQPAHLVWHAVLESSEDEMNEFFNNEDGVRDVTQATVRALCAIYLVDATIQPFHIDTAVAWAEIRDNDNLNDFPDTN